MSRKPTKSASKKSAPSGGGKRASKKPAEKRAAGAKRRRATRGEVAEAFMKSYERLTEAAAEVMRQLPALVMKAKPDTHPFRHGTFENLVEARYGPEFFDSLKTGYQSADTQLQVITRQFSSCVHYALRAAYIMRFYNRDFARS